MKKKIKKAFTLVELLVVIAILAILATVSIVGYNSFTKKAKVSNDTVLVKQMNDILIASKQTDEANPTMEDAISDVLDGGYDLDKLTPTTANYNIVWDSKNDQMVLLDENMNAVYPSDVDMTKKYNYFTMISNEDEMTRGNKVGFSYYLKDGFISDGVIETSTGIDVGRNNNISTINYNKNDDSKAVIIRTNSYDTNLNINAITDTVKHFNKLGSVTLTAIAPHSYHEYGDIQGNIEIANGRVVMENGSNVSAIKVTATANDINNGTIISVDNNSSKKISIVVPEDVKQTIESKGGDNGIKADADSIITDTKTINNMNNFAGGLGTETSPYLIKDYQQLSKISLNRTSFYKLISKIIIYIITF